MKCALCNGNLLEGSGRIELETNSLGRLLSPVVKYHVCSTCGEKLLDPVESTKIVSHIRNSERELVNSLPIGEFLSANEAAEYLGVTKQAFSKNIKIKSGVVYCAEIGKKKFYHKKSLDAFKSTGNGKFYLPALWANSAVESQPLQQTPETCDQAQVSKQKYTSALGDGDTAYSPQATYAEADAVNS